MIESIIFTLGCIVGLSLGLFIGYRRGYKTGLDSNPIPLEPSRTLSPLPFIEARPNRYDCLLRIPNAEKPEDRIRLASHVAMDISKKIARQLLADKVIRPVILDSNIGYNGAAIEIGASIYAMSNPAFNDYPTLVFSQPENT